MANTDLVYEQFHLRHDPKWSVQVLSAGGGGLLLCLACAIELMETKEIAAVRKCFALSSLSGVLKRSAGVLRELFRQDHRVTLHFITTLLGMLQTEEDPVTVENVDQVLVQLLLEFQNELPFHFVLDEVQKQLNGQLSGKHFLPTFNFLGNLLKTVPNVAHSLITQYVPLLDFLCSALVHPDEELKTSVVHVWLQLMQTSGVTSAQYLPIATRDRLCSLLLQTFSHARSPQLIKNCAGLLWQLVKYEEAVSVLMSISGSQLVSDGNGDILTNNSQSLCQEQEQKPADHSLLPLLLKKLLLSGDEMLQVTSAKCIAAILVHSPSQYCALCIKADLPGFLFDRLASSSSEMLLWSVYSCLVLLTEEPLFFSQCHSVYGIEFLVRSLKEALQLSNLEVPKQGFLLLTEILERQPSSIHLFPSGSGFVAVSEAVTAGVSSSCLLLAAQAVKAAAALLRLNHQSSPVQYQVVEELIEAITRRFPELILPSPSQFRSTGNRRMLDSSNQTFRSKGFLLQALICFQAACRLAEECASDPALMKNPFTAPYKHGDARDSLESVCQCLLRCCDSVWIPSVLRTCNGPPSAQILESLYSILCSQFVLLPSVMPEFAKKLDNWSPHLLTLIVSSGFYRLAVEHKALLCSGNRNPNLNASCCGFLQKLSMCLLFQSDSSCGSYHDFEEVENLLRCNLSSLCCHLSDWPSLLCEYEEPRAVQYCLVIMIYLALKLGDRLLPDQTVFSSVVVLLQSVQEQANSAPPRSVLRSALYLLAVTQERSPSLDRAHLNCISKALSCHSFSSFYSHHPALLHFIWRYTELAETFGASVLELWLAKKSQMDARQETADVQDSEEKIESQTQQDPELDLETLELLALMEKHPNVILTLLDMAVSEEAALAENILRVLKALLQGPRETVANVCINLRPALLQALQRISVDNMANGLRQANSLPVVLKLLCLTQASDPTSPSIYSNMEGVHFKLLYHVSRIGGMLKAPNTESLLPVLDFLQCCLSLSPEHSSDRAVSVLLSNTGLMEQLQTVVSSSSAPPPPPALLSCSLLLLSSLITLQRIHSTQVHKSVVWSLDTAVQQLLCQKRNTDNLLLVSYLRMLQALLDVDMTSPVVCLSTDPGLVGDSPLEPEDEALYPLGWRGAQFLLTALSGLLMQKHELLLRTSVNCLSSLLRFLDRKNPDLAKQAVCQPWTQFLLYCKLSYGEKSLLHPAVLRLITLLLHYSSTAVLWEPDLLHVIDTVERSGLKELNHEEAQALRLLLAKIQSSVPTEDQMLRVTKLMESLGPNTCVEKRTNVLHVGDVSLCMSEFSLKTD